ncbi:expressed protein [Phakopsora pachyrhizi]|uniref:Expressed protein n=1 Tax=Phakopsora pachyrhizi TaxID=170000 RepID=A0AAV0AML2_PHAPC|nr:expressed protein [Phakopsora pachyrhizi]
MISTDVHLKHPLYAFLKPTEDSEATPDSSLNHEAAENPNRDQSLAISIGSRNGSLTRDLITVVSNVRAHSAQLDTMVNHLNSLVRRVESVESLTEQAHDQLHESIGSLKVETDRISVTTSDRTTSSIYPMLGSLNIAMGFLNHQIKRVESNSEIQQELLSQNRTSVTRIERDLGDIKFELRRLDTQILQERKERSQNSDFVREELKAINTSLDSFKFIAPMLKGLFKTQLCSGLAFEKDPEKIFNNLNIQHQKDRQIRKSPKRRHSDISKTRPERSKTLNDIPPASLASNRLNMTPARIKRQKSRLGSNTISRSLATNSEVMEEEIEGEQLARMIENFRNDIQPERVIFKAPISFSSLKNSGVNASAKKYLETLKENEVKTSDSSATASQNTSSSQSLEEISSINQKSFLNSLDRPVIKADLERSQQDSKINQSYKNQENQSPGKLLLTGEYTKSPSQPSASLESIKDQDFEEKKNSKNVSKAPLKFPLGTRSKLKETNVR